MIKRDDFISWKRNVYCLSRKFALHKEKKSFGSFITKRKVRNVPGADIDKKNDL